MNVAGALWATAGILVAVVFCVGVAASFRGFVLQESTTALTRVMVGVGIAAVGFAIAGTWAGVAGEC